MKKSSDFEKYSFNPEGTSEEGSDKIPQKQPEKIEKKTSIKKPSPFEAPAESNSTPNAGLTPLQKKTLETAQAVQSEVVEKLSPLWDASLSDWLLRFTLIGGLFAIFIGILSVPRFFGPSDLPLLDKIIVIVGKTYVKTMKRAKTFDRGFWDFFENGMGFPAHMILRWEANKMNQAFILGRNQKWFTLKAKIMSMDMDVNGLQQVKSKIDLQKSFGFTGLSDEFLEKAAEFDTPVRVLFPLNLLRHKAHDPKPFTFQPVFFIHGGAWMVGGRNTSFYEVNFETIFSEPLENGNIPFGITVDYRRAPEKPHPYPIMDCFSAVSWWINKENQEIIKKIFASAIENFHLTSDQKSEIHAFGIEQSKILLGGDSAGGQLSVATAALIRDQYRPKVDNNVEIEKMYLIYPAIGLSKRENAEFKTFFDFLTIFKPTTILSGYARLFKEQSADKEKFKNDDTKLIEEFLKLPQVNTLKTEKTLKGLAKKWLFMTGKYDHFRGDSIIMMDDLKRSGEQFEWKEYPAIHGFYGQVMKAGAASRTDLFNFFTGKQNELKSKTPMEKKEMKKN